MVRDFIVLETNSHGLITSHTTSDLAFSFAGEDAAALAMLGLVKKLDESILRIAQVGDAFTPLSSLGETGGDVMHATGVLVLVAVLTASPRTREPLNSEIVVSTFRIGVRHRDIHVDDGNGHGARVDTAPAFSGRHSLDAMAADFMFERVETFAFDFEDDLM